MAKKVTFHSAEELWSMDYSDVLKIYNRSAERYNKQITRAKKRGINLDIIGGDTRPKVYRNKKTSPTKARLIAEYQIHRIRFGENINEEGIQKKYEQFVNDMAEIFGNETEAFKKSLERMLASGSVAAQQILNLYRDAVSKVSTGKLSGDRGAYYEALKRDVNNLNIDSFAPSDREGTVYDYGDHPTMEAMNALLKHINEVLG